MDYLGRPNVIPKVLKSKREKQERSDLEGDVSIEECYRCNLAGVEDEGGP